MLNPSVRIVMEGTGVVVTTLPPFTSVPVVNQEIALTEDGDPETVYKVESVRWYVHTVSQSGEGFPTQVGVNAHLDIIVSVVP